MRLICPNCGAQYQVGDGAIPAHGRNVLCSSCGYRWFHAHPETLVAPAPQPVPAAAASIRVGADDDDDYDEDDAFVPPVPPRRRTDESVLAVLREEAAREEAARLAESAARGDAAAWTSDRRPPVQTWSSGAEGVQAAASVAPPRRRFRLGFVLALAFFAALAGIYLQNRQIAAAFPAAAPGVSAYVTQVDDLRLWLDRVVSAVRGEASDAGE
ncbi:zinc-ribbon domain-containing protein [Tropicimonas sp. IMCC34043]|uniref:zinc-ribbon domain-containing protein n=1 Tax=Tropicimonas sp. IMCC34043 TaxID=2248760 RepID=UPI001300428F|nr:zinc-ribbon domain-containing protein [Tropicimonas sp. IMCC34043]